MFSPLHHSVLPLVTAVDRGQHSMVILGGECEAAKNALFTGASFDMSDGLISFAAESIFGAIERRQRRFGSGPRPTVRVCWYELQGERIVDLLASVTKANIPARSNGPGKLQLRDDPKAGVVVPGILEVVVSTAQDVRELLLGVARKRGRRRPTSHSVFDFAIEAVDVTGNATGATPKANGGGDAAEGAAMIMGRLTIVDVASDQQKVSVPAPLADVDPSAAAGGAADSNAVATPGGGPRTPTTTRGRGGGAAGAAGGAGVVGGTASTPRSASRSASRGRAGGKVSQWGPALDNVLTMLEREVPNVPFHRSKLTQILRDGLTGKANAALICAVASDIDSVASSLRKTWRRGFIIFSVAKCSEHLYKSDTDNSHCTSIFTPFRYAPPRQQGLHPLRSSRRRPSPAGAAAAVTAALRGRRCTLHFFILLLLHDVHRRICRE